MILFNFWTAFILVLIVGSIMTKVMNDSGIFILTFVLMLAMGLGKLAVILN